MARRTLLDATKAALTTKRVLFSGVAVITLVLLLVVGSLFSGGRTRKSWQANPFGHQPRSPTSARWRTTSIRA